MRDELVLRNVAKLVQVKTPRYEVGRGLSVDQARTLLRCSQSDRLHALYVLAVYLGLRRGELLGLRWLEPPPGFHDMRHTCVSLLLAEGAPPHVVQQIVGHSAIDVTMTIYAHASLDEKRTALQQRGERLA